ncbi:hypothetical protein EN873_14485 [bacterium M00.F.Ca.ET.230.01.1.1]|nr:hypothetical protein EN873_14485 [bacterium M00.F.Ca.ET.230.01.1.1]
MRLLFRLLIPAVLVAGPTWAQDWGAVVNVSTTMGITGNRLCYGEASRGDIGCPSNAPMVSGSTITGTFVGDGSGLTGLTVTTDRIVSGTSSAVIDPTGALTVAGRLEIVTGTNVVALGNNAGLTNTGSAVTLVGKSAGSGNAGTNVVGVGDFAGQTNTGSALTAVGHAAAQTNTGNNVTALGAWAGVSNTYSNVTLLGYAVYIADKSNQVVLGNSNVVEVSTSGVYVGKGVSITGTVTATNFVGNGSGLTGISTVTDRLTSGTSVATLSPNGNLSVRGLLDIVTGTNVVVVGSGAGLSNSGTGVTALGASAARLNNAVNVTALGYGAGYQNTGSTASLVGTYAGYSNAGANTAAAGAYAAQNNSGTNVTAMGTYAAQNNTGNSITAAGYLAGQTNTGLYLSALGYAAGQINSGDYSTLVGGFAGQNNTQTHLTGVGYFAGKDNTSAYVTAVGEEAGQLNSGYALVAMGVATGKYNTGSNSTVIGSYAGQYNTGLNTAALGYLAGRNNIASNVTALGAYAVYTGGVSNTYSNVTGVGFNAQPNKSNQVILGDGNVVEVSTAGVYVGAGLKATGIVTATYFEGDGSRLTNLSGATGDRITSSTTAAAIANQNGGTVSFTLGGTAGAAYLHPTLGLVASGISTTGTVSASNAYVTNNLAVSVTTPEFPIQLASRFGVRGDGVTYWGQDVRTASNQNAGLLTWYTGRVAIGARSASTDVAFVTNGSVERMRILAATGNVGVGTATPTTPLEVSGTVSATILQLADGPPATCGPGAYGTMKMVNGRPYYCRP